jgi:MoxR-like ATPase
MQERQITIGEQTYKLEEPFLVLATQNPIEQEGTYPLPEAQTDRFMLKVVIGYPKKEEEMQIIRQNITGEKVAVKPILEKADILKARQIVREVYIDEKIEKYIVDIVFATRQPEVIEVEKVVEKEIIVRDTVYVQQLEEIEKNFNATQFEQGKAELNEDAKFVLHDLAKLMDKNPTLKVKIVGHTSAEGDANLNQKLSEARAQAAVDFLVARGIATERLDAEGKGSSEPLDVNNPEVNRRTEFVVFE